VDVPAEEVFRLLALDEFAHRSSVYSPGVLNGVGFE
jgi:hypothetical protein